MFLNKEKFKEELAKIFNEAEKEIVIVVPYIKMSKAVFSLVKKAIHSGVQILIICREDGVREEELVRLKNLKKVTLMTHPNLHSKIYLNQENIIVGSMNLYDYSEFFNREAGFLIAEYFEEEWDDCKEEINDIISGAELLFESEEVKRKGLKFDLITTHLDEAFIYNERLNRLFKTKKFRVMSSSEGDYPSCDNFYDNIAVVFSNRVAIFPQYDKQVIKRLFIHFKNMPVGKFHPFRTYISEYHKNFTIYAPKGKYLEDELIKNPKFASQIEKITINLCKEIDAFYKNEYKKMQRA